jgi:phosphotransferase system HPr (HPr) family protein
MTQTQSRDVVIREDDFARLLPEASRVFGSWANAVLADHELLTQRSVMIVMGQHAHALETFLDDHGCAQNRTFVTIRELVACARGLCAVKSNSLHLSNRLPRYPALIDKADLRADLDVAGRFLDESLLAILRRYSEEGARWGGTREAADVRDDGDLRQRRLLPRNLDEEDSVDERHHIAEIGARFLRVLETSRSLGLRSARSMDALPDFAATHATEERCRWYESNVHSIQSMYDTYVLNTSVERDHPWLQSLRGHVSIALHLLEMATDLMHFYERHESDIRHEAARNAIAAVVSKTGILDTAVNTCLRHAYLFVEGASESATQILQTFVRQARLSLSLPPGVTLHARPLALIVQVARHYGTPLEIAFDGEICSATSLMSLIMLGGRHPRPATIDVKGDSRALRDLQALFDWGLGEFGGEVPAGLEYLKVRT